MKHTQERCKNRIITTPNVLSFFRLCLIPLIIWQYVFKHNYDIALYLLVLSGLTDIADGIIARKFDMVSDFGKAFDPIADKLTQIAMLLCLVTRFHNMWLPLILLVVKEVFAGITGLMMVRKGLILGADWHGKATTVLLYGTVMVHLAWVNISAAASNTLIGACTAMIILSGILYAIRNLRFLFSGGNAHEKG